MSKEKNVSKAVSLPPHLWDFIETLRAKKGLSRSAMIALMVSELKEQLGADSLLNKLL